MLASIGVDNFSKWNKTAAVITVCVENNSLKSINLLANIKNNASYRIAFTVCNDHYTFFYRNFQKEFMMKINLWGVLKFLKHP